MFKVQKKYQNAKNLNVDQIISSYSIEINRNTLLFGLSMFKILRLFISSYTSLKAPLHTKLTLMDCGICNTNFLGSFSSVLGYDCFYMKSTDGATMYFNLGSGIGSGRIQTDY